MSTHVNIEDKFSNDIREEASKLKYNKLFTSSIKDNKPVFVPNGKYNRWLGKDKENADYLVQWIQLVE